MYDSMLQEIARQHIRDLHDEASNARIARLARDGKRQEVPERASRRRFRASLAR